MKRDRIKRVKEYFYIYVGAFIAAVGIDVFLVPSNLAPGGATGLSILANYLFGVPVGIMMLVINIPLFIIALKIFGKTYGFKTFLGIIFLSGNIELVQYMLPGFDKLLDYTDSGNILLGALYSGLLMGVGIGLVIKNGGTTGGSDIVSGIINKYFRIPIGQALILIDSIVILMAAFIFGAEKAMYALINLYISGVVINKMITGLGNAKMAYIITSEVEEVRKIIVEVLGKTGNHYEANALYSGNKRDVITTVLRNREIFLLKDLIMGVDKEAFVVVSDVHEVLGRGYTFDVNAVASKRKEKIEKNGK